MTYREYWLKSKAAMEYIFKRPEMKGDKEEMTNYEWLIKERAMLVKSCLIGDSIAIAVDRNQKVEACNHIACRDCNFNTESLTIGHNVSCKSLRAAWLRCEHNPYTIPLDTPIDTKVLVSMDGQKWYKRYFAGFDKTYKISYLAYDGGNTSWSAEGDTTHWKHCKLAEEENK